MKWIIVSLIFPLVSSPKAYCQKNQVEKLYWVVENNIHYRDCSIVRFYNQNNMEVHKIKLQGVFLDVRIPKHRRKIEQLLRDYVEKPIVNTAKKKIESGIQDLSRGG